jgi:HNH endonuclease
MWLVFLAIIVIIGVALKYFSELDSLRAKLIYFLILLGIASLVVAGGFLYKTSHVVFAITIASLIVLGIGCLYFWVKRSVRKKEEHEAAIAAEKARLIEMINSAMIQASGKPVDLEAKVQKQKWTWPGYPNDWNERRQRVLLRDEYECVLCGAAVDLETAHVHHVKRRSDSGSYEYSNLVCLCKPCHAVMDGHEILSQPYYSINDDTKCVHTPYCRYVSRQNRTAPSFPRGYHACGICSPISTVQSISSRALDKKRRRRYPIIKKYLDESALVVHDGGANNNP